MKSSGNCGRGISEERHEPRSVLSKWRLAAEPETRRVQNSAPVDAVGTTGSENAVVEREAVPPFSLRSATVKPTPVPFVDAAPLGDADRPHERDGTPNPITD